MSRPRRASRWDNAATCGIQRATSAPRASLRSERVAAAELRPQRTSRFSPAAQTTRNSNSARISAAVAANREWHIREAPQPQMCHTDLLVSDAGRVRAAYAESDGCTTASTTRNRAAVDISTARSNQSDGLPDSRQWTFGESQKRRWGGRSVPGAGGSPGGESSKDTKTGGLSDFQALRVKYGAIPAPETRAAEETASAASADAGAHTVVGQEQEPDGEEASDVQGGHQGTVPHEMLSAELSFSPLDESCSARDQLVHEARARVAVYLRAKCPHRIEAEMLLLGSGFGVSRKATLQKLKELEGRWGLLCGVALTVPSEREQRLVNEAAATRQCHARAVAGGLLASGRVAKPAIIHHIEQTNCLPYMRDLINPEWYRIQSEEKRFQLSSARFAPSYDSFTETLMQAASKASHVEIATIGASTVGKIALNCFRCAAAQAASEKCVRVLVVGGVHPREWQALCTVKHIALSLFKESSIAGPYTAVDIVPCANPDGLILSLEEHRAWRGNARNVDLNRNFSAGWQHNDRSSLDERGWNYRGASPMSEAESKAIDSLLAEREYHLVLDVHSQGGEIIGYIRNTAQAPAPMEVQDNDRVNEYMMQRRRRRLAGEDVGAIDPVIQKQMELQAQRNSQRLQEAKVKRVESLDEALCKSLCEHTQLDVKWRRSACGALQCHAIEVHGTQCFVVETPPPKTRQCLFNKFDFVEVEAAEMASEILGFLRDHFHIRQKHDASTS